MRKLILALAALALLAGCSKKDVTYTGKESGFIQNGVFLSDGNVKMTIMGNERNYDIDSPRRVLIAYETCPGMDDGNIGIDLQGMMAAIIREPSHVETMDENPSETPIQVSDAWFSGGYLNILASARVVVYDKHQCSATYTADENGIVIRLTHSSAETVTAGSGQMANVFLSLPMEDPVLTWEHCCQAVGKKAVFPVPVLFQWTDNVVEAGPVTLCERKGTYTPPASN